ncbi:MAG: ArsR/SmtB family transcription factor [Promethearchaeota archaeon]
MDYDKFFDLMGNNVRRKILSCLVRGPMSIRELDEVINVSRQALLKQLKLLQNYGLIEIREAKTNPNKKGPSPYIYNLKKFYTMHFEMTPAYFDPSIMLITFSNEEIKNGLKSIKAQQDLTFADMFRELEKINEELDVLTKQYNQKIYEKNLLIKNITDQIESVFTDSEEKEVLYHLLKDPVKARNGISFDEIVKCLNLRKDFVEKVLENLEKMNVIRRKSNGLYIIT